MFLKRLFVLVLIFAFVGCGIKGAPIPPQQHSYISDGSKRIKTAEEIEKERAKKKALKEQERRVKEQ